MFPRHLTADPIIETDTPAGGAESSGTAEGDVEPVLDATVGVVESQPEPEPQPADAPEALSPLASIDLMMPLAISEPGYYTVGDDAVPLTVYVDDASTNTHTMPAVLWSNGDTLYVAVKSTHYLQWMTLKGVLNTGMDEYNPWVPIYIDGVKYDPTGLTGNTGSSHWTVFSGPLSSIDLSQPLTYSYYIKGIGVGHDVSGTFEVEPPPVSLELSKVWDGGLMPDVTVDLMRKVGTGAGVLVSAHTLTAASPSVTISNLPHTDSAGRIYTYYVVEPTPPTGYAFTYTATFNAATMTWTIVGTNTFTVPTGDIVGRKVWDGGPATKPAVELQLFRNDVAYGETLWTTEHVFTVTWEDVPLTDPAGNPYVYRVEEVTVPVNYTMTKDDALTVRNTWSYVPPVMDLTVKKVWGEWDEDSGKFINVGPTPPPTLQVQLTRNGVAVAGEVKTIVSAEVDAATNEWVGSVTWTDLPETGPLGIPILWSVVKIDAPANYGAYVSRAENTITYQNVYESPSTRVRVLKVWEGGPVDPSDPPPVTIVLERSLASDPGAWESAGEILAVELVPPAPGVPAIWGYEFVTERTDTNGEAYIFRGNEVPFGDEAPYTHYVMSRSEVDPLIVINTFVSPKIDITGTKMWFDGPVGGREVELQLYREGVAFGDPVTLTESAGAESSYTWNVDRYDSDGIELHYRVDEVTTPANYIRSNPDDLTVVNTYTPPLIDVVGHKLWDGGQGMNFPFTLQLTADGVDYGDPVTVAPRQSTYTWEDLPATKLDGTPIRYAIAEPNPPANYEAVQVDDLTIRNVFTPPLRDFTGYKVWVGGSAVRTDIKLQLFEGVTPIGDPVDLPRGVTSYTWEDIPATDHNGLPLSYWIDEVEVPDGFSKDISNDGTTVTNTYASDTIDVTGRKLWSGGPSPRPDVTLQLLRDGVAFGDPVTLVSGADGYTWIDLDRTDSEGVAYTYTIDEPIVPANYKKEIAPGGLTIVNTYVSPKIDITGTKAWVGGPSVKPAIKLQLFRDGQPVGAPVTVASGSTGHTWEGLDQNDVNGIAYVYRVDEVDVPVDYVKTVSADGLTITNTYVSPKIDVTGTKVWVGGSSPRPAVELQLLRDGAPLGDPVTLADATTTYTWAGLDETDVNGVAYVYTVDEVDVPVNYVKEIAPGGLTIVNTYASPKADVTGTKVWVGGKAPRPTIQLQLYRDGLAIGDPVSLADGTTAYTWTGLDVNDSAGHPYTYTVREVAVPDGYTSIAEGLKVTNTAKPVTVTIPVKASPKTGDVATGAIAALALGAFGLIGAAGASRITRRRER